MTEKFLLKKPLITEKSTDLGKLGKYTFLIDQKVNAVEAKKVVENVYKVKVVNTNVINVKSKKRRLGNSVGIKSGYKKIIMTLKEGQKLDILPQ